jgi:RNA polymerase sigma-70 factor, ECF subfamily
MSKQDRHNLFAELVARHHSQLYAYILATVRNRVDADDVFQSVYLVLWRKFESFDPNSSHFYPWARQTAKLVIYSFFRHKKKLLNCVGEELLDALAETVLEDSGSETESYLAALEHCRERLDAADQELLELRYAHDLGSREIADRLRRPQTSVCRSLNRVRNWLYECIEMELGRQGDSGEKLS